MFFLKKKNVVVNCFVSENYAFSEKYAPLAPASKFYPDWWKNLETEHFDFEGMANISNMKSCVGFINNFKNGFIIPMWCDLALDVGPDFFQYHFADANSVLTEHPNNQAAGFYENFWLLKIHSPWLLKCERKNVNFVYQNCMWNSTQPTQYIVPHGIVDFHINNSTHLFALVERKRQQIFINFQQPMVHYIPMTEDNIDLRIEVISNEEWFKMNLTKSMSITFNKKGLNQKRIEQGKCPLKTIIKKTVK